MQDEQIIDLYFDRDENAISQTKLVYGHYCFAIAENILGNREDAEETVSDTLLQAWNSIPPTRPTRLKQYLGKIARNLAFSLWRSSNAQKRGADRTAVALEELGECVPSDSHVEDRLQEKELRDTINAFLREVSERESDIFLRRYFYLEETRTIAKHYRMSEGNVLQVLSRTRKKLKLHLIKEGYVV